MEHEHSSLIFHVCTLQHCVHIPEQTAASSVPLSGSSSGTDEASLGWNYNCMQENVQGWRFGGRVVDAQFVINRRSPRIFGTAAGPKIETKWALGEYLIAGPPIVGIKPIQAHRTSPVPYRERRRAWFHQVLHYLANRSDFRRLPWSLGNRPPESV